MTVVLIMIYSSFDHWAMAVRKRTERFAHWPNGILFFANANRVLNRLRKLINQTGDQPRLVLVDLEASPEIDATSLEMLAQLKNELPDSGVTLYFARVSDPIRSGISSGAVDSSKVLVMTEYSGISVPRSPQSSRRGGLRRTARNGFSAG